MICGAPEDVREKSICPVPSDGVQNTVQLDHWPLLRVDGIQLRVVPQSGQVRGNVAHREVGRGRGSGRFDKWYLRKSNVLS